MDLGQEFWVCDRYDLLKFSHLTEVVTESFPHIRVGIIFETADHVEYSVLCKHHLEQGVVVEQKNVREHFKEVMETLQVIRILTNVKQV